MKKRVFHEINHPFWWVPHPYFWVQHPYDVDMSNESCEMKISSRPCRLEQIFKHPGCPIYVSHISQMVKSGVVHFCFPCYPNYSLSGAMLNFHAGCISWWFCFMGGVESDFFITNVPTVFPSNIWRIWTLDMKLKITDLVKFRECDWNTAAFVWQGLLVWIIT